VAGRLAEELWRGAAPPGAAVTVRSYVSRLRSALAPEVAVAARGGGYAIDIGPDQLDASRFERLVAAGHDALAGGRRWRPVPGSGRRWGCGAGPRWPMCWR
jgi:DNA-binding SARP family transcriptional activator